MSILVSTYTISTLTPPSAQFSSDATGSHQAQLPQAQASRDLGGKSASDTGGDAATATSPGNRLIASESVTVCHSAEVGRAAGSGAQPAPAGHRATAKFKPQRGRGAAKTIASRVSRFATVWNGLGPGAGRAGQTNQRCSGRSESRRRKRSHIDD